MYSFAVIGIRLLAAYLILTGLASSGYVLAPIFENPETYSGENYYYYSLWVVSSLVFGGLIFLLARPFAGIIVHALPKTEIKVADIEIVTVGTFLIGLFLVGDYLPNAIAQTFILNSYSDTGILDAYSNSSSGVTTDPYIFASWAPVFGGALIMIGTSPISKLFSKLRKL